MDEKDASPSVKTEHRDAAVTLDSPGAVASAMAPEVKIELDRIGKIVKGTEEGVEWTKRGIKITIALSSVAIALSVISMALQYFKII